MNENAVHFGIMVLMLTGGLLCYYYHNTEYSDVYMPMISASACGTMIWALMYEQEKDKDDKTVSRSAPENLFAYACAALAIAMACYGASQLSAQSLTTSRSVYREVHRNL